MVLLTHICFDILLCQLWQEIFTFPCNSRRQCTNFSPFHSSQWHSFAGPESLCTWEFKISVQTILSRQVNKSLDVHFSWDLVSTNINGWPRWGWPHRGFARYLFVQWERMPHLARHANQHWLGPNIIHLVFLDFGNDAFKLVEFVLLQDIDLAYFSLVWFRFLKVVQQGIADHTERLVAICSTWKDATSGGVCLSHQNPNNAIILFFLLELGLGFRQWVFA